MISVNVRCMYGSIMLPRICLYIQLKITGVECHLISHYQVYLSIHCHWTRYNILSQTLIWIVLFKLINLKFNYVIRQYQRKKKKKHNPLNKITIWKRKYCCVNTWWIQKEMPPKWIAQSSCQMHLHTLYTLTRSSTRLWLILLVFDGVGLRLR